MKQYFIRSAAISGSRLQRLSYLFFFFFFVGISLSVIIVRVLFFNHQNKVLQIIVRVLFFNHQNKVLQIEQVLQNLIESSFMNR
jgi:hypothetical protein